MQTNITIFNNKYKCMYITNEIYKEMIVHIENNDLIGICDLIEKITGKNINVYIKFILMLSLFNKCIDSKLNFTKDQANWVFYIDDIINAMHQINDSKWIDFEDYSIQICLPVNFFIHDTTEINISEINDYFLYNCITAIKINKKIYTLSREDVDELPSYIIDKVLKEIRIMDEQLHDISIFKDINITISLFSLLNVLIIIYKTDVHNYLEFEYILRKYAKITNFDNITYKTAHELIDIYSHDLQDQKSAIEEAKQQYK